MKAVRFDRYGGIEVLQVANVPMPEPSHGEALVKVQVRAAFSLLAQGHARGKIVLLP